MYLERTLKPMTDNCEDCSGKLEKHQDPGYCLQVLKKGRKTYRIAYWCALALLCLQTVFYIFYVTPQYEKINNTWAEHSASLEWQLDGCYEVKVQFNDLYEDYHHLSPKLQSDQYTMRLRVK